MPEKMSISDLKDFFFLLLLLGRKVMTNLDSIFKSIDITLPTKVGLVKAMVFPVVMYGCESWTVKKSKKEGINVCIFSTLLYSRKQHNIVKQPFPPIKLIEKKKTEQKTANSKKHSLCKETLAVISDLIIVFCFHCMCVCLIYLCMLLSGFPVLSPGVCSNSCPLSQ